MDPLSDVLSLLKARSYMSGSFDIGGDWSFQFGPFEGIKFFAVVSGEFWVAVDGGPEPARVRAGDCFLLPRGWPFRLASDLALVPTDASLLVQQPPNGGVRTISGGGDSVSVGGYVAFAGSQAEILLGVLPPVVHIRKASDKAAIRWSLERLMLELREPQPGGFLVAQQLATTIVVQALRLHLADKSTGSVGWLFALADKPVSAAIHAMHEDPAHRWTLQSLAERAGMSRTAFTLRFRDKVGKSPMDYLTGWRMLLAGERLKHSSDAISVIALSLGYESESAFSTAFRRVTGCSPRQHGRGRLPVATSHIGRPPEPTPALPTTEFSLTAAEGTIRATAT